MNLKDLCYFFIFYVYFNLIEFISIRWPKKWILSRVVFFIILHLCKLLLRKMVSKLRLLPLPRCIYNAMEQRGATCIHGFIMDLCFYMATRSLQTRHTTREQKAYINDIIERKKRQREREKAIIRARLIPPIRALDPAVASTRAAHNVFLISPLDASVFADSAQRWIFSDVAARGAKTE